MNDELERNYISISSADEQNGAEEYVECGNGRSLPRAVHGPQATRPGVHLHGADAGAAQEVV